MPSSRAIQRDIQKLNNECNILDKNIKKIGINIDKLKKTQMQLVSNLTIKLKKLENAKFQLQKVLERESVKDSSIYDDIEF